MALPATHTDREFQKFVEVGGPSGPDGSPALRVVLYQAGQDAIAISSTAFDNAAPTVLGLVTHSRFQVYQGTGWYLARAPFVFKPVELTSGTAETTIWTPASGKRLRLMGGILTASAQTKLTFKDNTGGTTILVLEPGANSPLPFDLGALGIFSGAANNVLTVTRSVAVTLNGTVWGTEE